MNIKWKIVFKSLFLSIILIGIIISVCVIPLIMNGELYQKTKNGILIEDVYLKHAEVVDYGGTIGRVLEYIDCVEIEIYAQKGDWCHVHCKTENNTITSLFYMINTYNGGHGWWNGLKDTFQFSSTGVYNIEIYNYDNSKDTHLTVFLIVYTNEYYPPICPFC